MNDFIGDIHGHADALVSLLEKLGYENTEGYYRRRGRIRLLSAVGAIFRKRKNAIEAYNSITDKLFDANLFEKNNLVFEFCTGYAEISESLEL